MTGMRSSFVLLVASTGLAVGSVQAQASPTSGGSSAAQRIEDQSARQHESSGNLRRRAEDLAGAASKRFSEILSEQESDTPAQDEGPEASRKSAQRANDLTLIPVWDWLARASRDYESIIVAKLKNPSGEVEFVTRPGRVVAQAELPSAPPAQTPPPPQPGWGSIIENIREWLARANRSYRNEIVKKLVRPRDGEDPWKAVVEAEGEGDPRPTAKAGTSPPEAEAEIDRGAVPLPTVEEPATPKEAIPATNLAEAEEKTGASDGGPGAEPKLNVEEVKRLAEKAEAEREVERDAEAKRVAEESEAKRLAEEAEAERKAAIEAERKRITDEVQAKRLAAEAGAERKAAREAEAKRIAEEAEAKRVAEESEVKRKAEEEAEAKRLAEEAEADRKAAREAEAKRLADEAEAKRLAEEAEAERKAAIEAERKRITDEVQAKRLAAEAEAERKAAREAEAKRISEEAEAKRLAEEAESKRKAKQEAEARRLAEETESKRQAEDAEAAARRGTAKEAEASRVAESTKVPQSRDSQAPLDTEKTEPPPVPVAKQPPSNLPANDRLPTAGAEKRVSTPSRPKAKKKKVRVRKASLRKKRVRKNRYRRRAARARSGTRVYAYKSRRKQARASRYSKDCWGRSAKQIAPRKVYRKRARGHGYRKGQRASIHGRSGMYVVRRGDTLWGIAKRHYGKGSKYRRIYSANRRKIRNPNRIYPSQRLYIPGRRR